MAKDKPDAKSNTETVQKEKPKALTDDEKVAKKVEELKELIGKSVEKEGKSEMFQILNSVSKSAIKSLEGGKATLEWQKIGNNIAIFARIPEPTADDCKKALLQLETLYLDLELKARHPPEEPEAETSSGSEES